MYVRREGKRIVGHYIVLAFSGSVCLMWPLDVLSCGKLTFFALKHDDAASVYKATISCWAAWKAIPTVVVSPLHVQAEGRKAKHIPTGILLRQMSKEVDVIEHAAQRGFLGVDDKVCRALAEDLAMKDAPTGRIPLLAALVLNILGCTHETMRECLETGLENAGAMEPSTLLQEAELESALLPEDKAAVEQENLEREDRLAEIKIRLLACIVMCAVASCCSHRTISLSHMVFVTRRSTN